MLYWLIFIFFGLGFVVYITTVVKNKVLLPKSTWIIWTLIDALTVFGLTGEKSGPTPLSIIALIGAAVTLLLAFFIGEMRWSPLDSLVSLGILVGIIFAGMFKSKDALVIIVQSVAFIGTIPVMVAAWKGYEKEWRTWLLWLIASVLMFFILKEHRFVDFAQPFNFTVSFSLVLLMMYGRKIHKKVKFPNI